MYWMQLYGRSRRFRLGAAYKGRPIARRFRPLGGVYPTPLALLDERDGIPDPRVIDQH